MLPPPQRPPLVEPAPPARRHAARLRGRVFGGRVLATEVVASSFVDATVVGHDLARARTVRMRLAWPELTRLPGYAEAFVATAERAARVRHPDVLVVRDFGVEPGQDDDGPWASSITDASEGMPLSTRLALLPRWSWRRSRAFGVRLAQALGAVHDEGVLLGAVALDDVHVVGPADGERPQLDLGIARCACFDAPAGRMPWAMRRDPGTLCAPEIDRSPADRRADVWLVGALLRRLLAADARMPPRARAVLDRLDDPDPDRRPRDLGEVEVALASAPD
ncbi:MAG: hypothetical protein K1X88_36120 [Nannocystaceae bacterium]|nr:hypothetical protein [Nannocystaceae bacterium]